MGRGRIFTYMKAIKNQPNVGKYTSPMDPNGMVEFDLVLEDG